MIGFIIQARTESSRYPNKIILPFYNDESILSILIDKLGGNFSLPIVLATSKNKSNDILESISNSKKIYCFRGSEEDVLERFIEAAELYQLNYIARVCSDNPFLDESRIETLLNEFQTKQGFDYYSFFVNESPSIKTHFGFWIEIVSLEALKRIKHLTDNPFYFEHVTNYIYGNPHLFKILWIKEETNFNPNLRMTIDTPEDFKNCSELYSIQKRNDWDLNELINFVSSKKKILERMRIQIIANTK